jgi:metal transporter CNNM
MHARKNARSEAHNQPTTNQHTQTQATNVLAIVTKPHRVLVTLLLCNAMAMETLPILLNYMVHESVAIIISVTAVLLFGEVKRRS